MSSRIGAGSAAHRHLRRLRAAASGEAGDGDPVRGRARTGTPAPLIRPLDRFPFVPDDPARLDQDCFEAFNIQVQGLMRRMTATGAERLCIGVSGGLDSTQALLVACRAFDRLKLPRDQYPRPTPCRGSRPRTGPSRNAWALMKALGVTGEEIDIRPAAERMLADIGIRMRTDSPSTTSPSRTCRRVCGPTICSGWPTRTRPSCWARATCRSWRWAGPPMASATI